MKRLLTLWFFSLLMLTSASAQNNLVITDSIFEAEMQGIGNAPKQTYPTPNPIDEELSLWHQLKNRFEIICMGDIDVKYQFRSYREGPKPFFLTTPAPAINSRTKME